MEKPHEPLEELRRLLKGIRFAMLTTLGEDGRFHSRPMATQEVERGGALWFFTGVSSRKVREVNLEPRVSLAYSDPDDNRYVSVWGNGKMVRDPAKAKELWSPALKAWFPKGLEDPELSLLRVDIEGAEYWDNPSSKLVQIVGFAKAVVTGQRATGLGEHGTLDLNH